MRFAVLLCVLGAALLVSATVYVEQPIYNEKVPVRSSGKKLTPTPGQYNTTSGPKDGILNVHIVSHTHDDVGWLKTVDEYYKGMNNSIQNAGVQYILDSVIMGLAQNPDRKFIYVEIGYFWRWWNEQTQQTRNLVTLLVENGQLEFINGGWCMSDEAAPYYVDMIDQQTLGHQFLYSQVSPLAIPVTGWQIDPFGHSTTMGQLYALMGMNSWFFGRIDWQDRDLRTAERTLEMMMLTSASLGQQADIFTGVTNGYGPISNFDWEQGSSDEPIQDDPNLENYNVDYEVDLFVSEVLSIASNFVDNNIMLTEGTDFNYQNANTWFKNIDKLIHYVNLDGRVNAFYSTPTIYTNAKHASNYTWSTKSDDFFPYADYPHAVWAGYFTSRPAVKGYVRSSSNILQSCRQIEIQSPSSSSESLSSFTLWEAMGLAQHHDAVSGTEKQHVAYDYAKQLSEGNAECQQVMANGLSNIISGQPTGLQFSFCQFLNQSICDATTSGQNTAIVIYSDLGQSRTEFIQVPVLANRTVTVTDFNGNAVQTDIIPIPFNNSISSAIFPVFIPAAGFSTYFLEYSQTAPKTKTATPKPPKETPSFISNSFYNISFDSNTGRINQIHNLASGVSTNLYQTFGWFNASSGNTAPGDNPGQASGAYIFRPNCSENTPIACDPFEVNPGSVTLSITQGQGVQEAFQVFASWLTQTIRLYENDNTIHISYTVGPIPVNDGLGKEIVTVWRTDLDVNSTWFTDSNGREMQQRRFNYRPTWDLLVTDPVSYNFFPVDSSIYIAENNTNGRQMTIMTDRAQGGASLHNGELQLMVHRRLLYDDRRGVGEPLNEPGTTGLGLVITASQRISFDTVLNSPLEHKWNTRALTFPPILEFTTLTTSPTQYLQTYKSSYSALNFPLPVELHLLTVQNNPYNDGTMILRLDHSFQVGEDETYSQPVTIDLDSIFATLNLQTCTEMTLTANQVLADVHRLVWPMQATTTTTRSTSRFQRTKEEIQANKHSFVVTINPMEIRTWSCTYNVV